MLALSEDRTRHRANLDLLEERVSSLQLGDGQNFPRESRDPIRYVKNLIVEVFGNVFIESKRGQESETMAQAQFYRSRRNPGELSPTKFFAGLLEVTQVDVLLRTGSQMD
jgi:hypothetical protein